MKNKRNILIALESTIFTLVALAVFSSIWSGLIKKGYDFANNVVIYNIAFDLVIIGVQFLILKLNWQGNFIEAVDLKHNKNTFRNALKGIIIGFTIVTLTYLTVFILGIVSYDGLGFDYYSVGEVMEFLGANFIRMLVVAISEEILFRGVILKQLHQSFNKYVCIFVSSMIFSVYHCMRYETITQLTSIFIMGIFLSYLFVKTKSIYASIGMHFAVDFFINIITIKGNMGVLILDINKGFTEEYLTLMIFGIMSVIAAIILTLIVINKRKTKKKISVN
ncbi:MAG: type II CAAX endopeptidase family protein [Clostridiaceae bacterium]|nr:type II CAAX endopeptidase family protein [Clostridiaceae bacterium]